MFYDIYNTDQTEYISLWEDEDETQKEQYDPQGKADNAETSVGLLDTTPIEGVEEILSEGEEVSGILTEGYRVCDFIRTKKVVQDFVLSLCAC